MDNGKVNGMIFKELVKRGYSQNGETRVWNIADSKLWYLTKGQAQAYLDLEQEKNYQETVIQKEIDLIVKNMDSIVKKSGDGHVNIIDIGCGDGKKAILFINALKKSGAKVRYCPIDISSYMVEKALKTIGNENIDELIEFQWNISDFENLNNVASVIREQRPGNNLFLLLGNTLGNFEINELMYEIRSSMRENEVLVIGNGLSVCNDGREALKAYDSENVHLFLRGIPEQLGLDESAVKFGARFENFRIELFYTLLGDQSIQAHGKKVDLRKGDEIIVSVSYKYNADDFKSIMNLYYDEAEVYASDDKTYALAVCRK